MTQWVVDKPVDYVQRQYEYNNLSSDSSREVYIEGGQQAAQQVIEFIRKTGRPDSILDIGCRTGYVIDTFQQAFPMARVVGVDIVPQFVEAASRVGEAIEADAHSLPFEDGEFDYTFCAQTLEHCHDVPKAISEMFRVARKGVFVAIPIEPKESFAANPSHMVFSINVVTWLQPFEQYGEEWQLLYVFPTNGDHYMNFYFKRKEA